MIPASAAPVTRFQIDHASRRRLDPMLFRTDARLQVWAS
jgi:hypothetical protein